MRRVILVMLLGMHENIASTRYLYLSLPEANILS